MIFGLSNFSYATSFVAAIMILLFDYLFAFAVVGFGGLFRNIKSQPLGLALGGLAAGFGRFVCHFISGVTVWGGFAEDMPAWLYSIVYNGAYMLPETIILMVGAVIVGLIIDFRSPRLSAVKKDNNT
ncbi:MAG: energy-coupled thiamine transporter ThiT [Ruminococcus sp.]|nr:energy-coupled thiamine transporter ThiT [Ruminococcus sp.]